MTSNKWNDLYRHVGKLKIDQIIKEAEFWNISSQMSSTALMIKVCVSTISDVFI